jgi:hydrogenase-1 operon protein HyaF
MSITDIPVRAVGPGSQPPEEDGQTLSYIDMPGDISTYQPPRVPEPETVAHLAGARQAMVWLREALSVHGTAPSPMLANLNDLDEASRELVNQILGEGEVSLTYDGAVRARTQEAVLAGVWRTLYVDRNDRIKHDLLEVADVPHLARVPDDRIRTFDSSEQDAPPDVMNALPILAELESRCELYRREGTPHTINLTLLPLSDADVAFLDGRLGRGPVAMLSRAYGRCQIISTQVADVWWVRYYNAMSTLILNTLEVVDVPQVACAAPEDLTDSRERLEEILAPYWCDVA